MIIIWIGLREKHGKSMGHPDFKLTQNMGVLQMFLETTGNAAVAIVSLSPWVFRIRHEVISRRLVV